MISTEQHLAVLTAEVLRDLGRNEAAGWAVRKASVKMLIERGHAFANHPDFRELRLEISEEAEAHAEVENIIAQVEPVQKMDESDKTCRGHADGPGECDCQPGPFKAGFTTKNIG
jgi:hypothetical protein